MLNIRQDTERLFICNIQKEDFPFVLAVYHDDFYKEAVGAYHIISNKNLFDMLFRMGSKDFFLVAKKKNASAFCGFIKGFMEIDKKILWISILAVDKNFLRTGYGTEIATGLTDYIKNCYNPVKILLTVKQTNLSAQKFWISLGFTLYATLQTNACVSYLYEKILV